MSLHLETMSMKVRRLDPELLDDPVQDVQELAESLAMVSQVNRFSHALGPVRRALRHYRRRACRILDVGSGNGDTAADLGGSREPGWSVIGVDLSHQASLVSRSRHPHMIAVGGDALRLPFADGAFDVAVSFLTLHHFDDDEAGEILREMSRVAPGRVVVSDLERHGINYVGARLLATTLWRRNRLTRHDGPLSVLKSFRAPELGRIARQAGLRDVRVRRHFPFRLVLTARGGGS